MPQLNPAPWFAILLFSWFVLLVVIPPKVMAHTFPNEPTTQSTEKPKTESWNWPWHLASSTNS
uniref:ATP synthase complex subunit 8 n=2 Tax=Monacanthidae TaxID=143346 RepID=B7ZHJ9_9TELE|nr:ATP synthase F0 subunit 8 [Scobinichthys granulatus]YP_002520026.1 ATP synthase F0 subunit 8 [Meuschenia hippocrepis]BAH10373.1 ATPase subunit 8 [Meuschenia hippocrepis]BAH10503.1 ATPase subunit 8 [Scobinichthys granulatus]